MTNLQRWLIGSVAISLVAGCASQSRYKPLRPVVPQEGPRATIYATVRGGLLDRHLEASFAVDQSAYVLVGHLSADGAIHIVYPKSPNDDNLVKAGTRIRTGYLDAAWDGTLGLMNYRFSAYRPALSRRDSYDGSGQSYVFIIASRTPLALDGLASFGEWDVLDADDYLSDGSDPRLAVRNLADALTGRAPYTINYASSFSTITAGNYMSAYECALLYESRLGFFSWWEPYINYPWYQGPIQSMRRSCLGYERAFAFYPRSNRVTFNYTTALAPTPQPPKTPKITRIFGQNAPNPRRTTLAQRTRPQSPFAETDGRIAGGSGSSSGSSGSVARTTTANSSPVSAPAPTRDSQGNAPKTKQ